MRMMSLAFTALLAASGCYGSFCEEFYDGACVYGAGGGGGGQSGGGGGQGGEGGEGGGGIPAECDPRVGGVADECGVFVNSASPATPAGTKSAPYVTLGAALAAVEPGQYVYVCESPLDENVILAAPAVVFGGLRCDQWDWTSGKTPLTAPENTVPLFIESAASGSLVFGFSVQAAPGAGTDPATRAGGSSIAAWVEDATVTLEQVDLIAGLGAPGGDADPFVGLAYGRDDDPVDFDGNPGGGCAGTGGGPEQTAVCPGNVVAMAGGKGGDGGPSNGGNGMAGADGTPSYGAAEPNGTGGMVAGSCSNGELGAAGPPGDGGPGGLEVGALVDGRYVGDSGDAGEFGGVGQGGGGGAGRPGNGSFGCTTGQSGGSGGSGGAGGCGGAGGLGGGAGGASIALVSLGASLTFINVSLTADAGGAGGTGAAGQAGGVGGNGGPGGGVATVEACDGGNGGTGGLGGAGGGGRGGHSLGIAHTGPAPELSGILMITVDDATAPGGDGGDNNSQNNAGEAGVSEQTLQF
jgi:hypothetical protein